MNRSVPDYAGNATSNMACKRNWQEIDDRSSQQVIIIDDDDADSYTAKPMSNSSIGTDMRYPHTKMRRDLAPTSEVKSSETPTEFSSSHPSYDDEEYTGMTQSERKRFREKKRRCAITSAVDNLSKVLLKVDRNSLVDRNGTPFGYQSSLNRTGTINRAARVLETLHQENEERKVQVTKLTALLREVSNGSVQFERPRQLQPQPQTSISQCLSALLNSAQQVPQPQQPPPQPAPFLTVQSGLGMQAPPHNEVPLSINRSTLENLIVMQRHSLEDKLRRRTTTFDGHASRGMQFTTADTEGGPSVQQKVFFNSSGTPSHVPSSDIMR